MTLHFQHALRRWLDRYRLALDLASRSALLQHIDYLDEPLLDTHFLSVTVTPKFKAEQVDLSFDRHADFTVLSAEVQPMDELKATYIASLGETKGVAEYDNLLESTREMMINTAREDGKVAGRIIWVVVRCLQTFITKPTWMQQKVVEAQKGKPHDKDWVEHLKTMVGNRGETVLRADGKLIVV